MRKAAIPQHPPRHAMTAMSGFLHVKTPTLHVMATMPEPLHVMAAKVLPHHAPHARASQRNYFGGVGVVLCSRPQRLVPCRLWPTHQCSQVQWFQVRWSWKLSLCPWRISETSACPGPPLLHSPGPPIQALFPFTGLALHPSPWTAFAPPPSWTFAFWFVR